MSTSTLSAEYREWCVLERLATELNRKLIFRAATNGRIGPLGIALPNRLDDQAHFLLYSWDSQAGQLAVETFGQPQSWPLYDRLRRCQLLRQAILLVKTAAARVEKWISGNDNPLILPWQELTCGKCGRRLAVHDSGRPCRSRRSTTPRLAKSVKPAPV